jgi:type II secretory ATPase GspE/PulE/Tfp pilus assembly ATPase PilB-like protein
MPYDNFALKSLNLASSHLLAQSAADFPAFIAWWKLIPVLIVFIVWTRLLTWIDKDTQKALLPRQATNAGMIIALAAAVAFFFILPGFGLAFGVFFAVALASIGIYLAVRAQKMGLADLQSELISGLKSIIPGGKKGEKKIREVAGEVVLISSSGQHLEQPADEDAWRVAYDTLQAMIAEPILKGATTIDIMATGAVAGSKYLIDGVAYDGPAVDRSAAGDAVSYVKSMCGLDLEDRRKPQAGKCKIMVSGKRLEVRVNTSGSRDGEIARLEIDVPSRYQFRPENIGFTADQLDRLIASRDEPGIILLAAPRGGGLTTLQYAMVRLHDAFTSHILTVERDPPIELEGITQNKLAAAAPPAEEAKTVAWVASQEPDVLLAGGLETPQAARSLIELAQTGKRVYVGVRASDAFEALEVWKKLVGDANLATAQLRTVIAGRLFRRLCDATKVAYQPDEKLLRQLGFGPGQVTELYRPHVGPLVDARGQEVPDTFCFGIGYRGRFGVYEIFNIDDDVRHAARVGQPQLYRQLFRKQKGRYIQELVLARVAAGDTSVQEFLRVLKPSAEAPKAPANA